MGNLLFTTEMAIRYLNSGNWVNEKLINEKFMENNWEKLTDLGFSTICENFYMCDISENFVEKHLTWNWDWKALSKIFMVGNNVERKRVNISVDFVEKYSSLNWDWGKISIHPSITERFVEKFVDKDWNWNVLTVIFLKKPVFTHLFLERHRNKPWDWKRLSRYLNSTIIEMYTEFEGFQWDWTQISNNKTLSLNFIQKYSKNLKLTKNILNLMEKFQRGNDTKKTVFEIFHRFEISEYQKHKENEGQIEGESE